MTRLFSRSWYICMYRMGIGFAPEGRRFKNDRTLTKNENASIDAEHLTTIVYTYLFCNLQHMT